MLLLTILKKFYLQCMFIFLLALVFASLFNFIFSIDEWRARTLLSSVFLALFIFSIVIFEKPVKRGVVR